MAKTIITEEATTLLMNKALFFMHSEEPNEERAEVMFEILCDELLEILPGYENNSNRAKVVAEVLVQLAIQSGIDLSGTPWGLEE